MKKLFIILSALAIALLFTACEPKEKTSDTESESFASVVSQTFPESATETDAYSQALETGITANASEPISSTAFSGSTTQQTTNTNTTVASTEARTTRIVDNPTKPNTTQPVSTYTGTTIIDSFVITKVSGKYLEMRKCVYGNDTEKLLYCCSIGDLDGSADMQFKVGDTVTIRYDCEVAETYPLKLTVREIYPATWNEAVTQSASLLY